MLDGVDTLLTIGELARRTGLTVGAVRFYADRGLLPPARVDPRSGYRRFSPAQVADGRLIRQLRLAEVPLAEIDRALSLGPEARGRLVDGPVRLSAGHGGLLAESGDRRIPATAVPVEFPGYANLLDLAPPVATVVVERAGLAEALGSLAADDDGPVTLLPWSVPAGAGPGIVLARSGRRIELAARVSAGWDPIALDPGFAIDAVDATPGPDLILELATPLTPVVFRSTGDAGLATLLMPVLL